MTGTSGAVDPRSYVVHEDAETLAQAVAARFVTAVADAQAARGWAHVVLTGGGVGTRVLEAVAASPAHGSVDWSSVEVWWGDERFVAAGDPDRNETGAREALLDRLPFQDELVHAMPSTGEAADAEAAAQAYAEALSAAAGTDGLVPAFDVLLLGVGEEGHVASLFPERAELTDERTVVPVHDSPKPPPTRTSLTLGAIGAAREVWLVAAGAGKADAIALLRAGAGPRQLPAAGALGREATRVLLDRAAAAPLV